MKPSIICTVDVVLLTLKLGELQVALLNRDHAPYADTWALPGGYINEETDADAQAAAARVLLAKTGIVSPYLEQLSTFSGPLRDPRGWTVSIAYYALVPPEIIESAGNPDIQLRAADRVGGLPFDHQEIIKASLHRIRSKSLYSSLPVHLCEERFTIPQLQSVYESILGEKLNKVTFRRKLDELGVLEPIKGRVQKGRQNRPAQLYRLKSELRGTISVVERGLNLR